MPKSFAQFIRSQPLDVPAAEIVARARAVGFKVPMAAAQRVHAARHSVRKKEGTRDQGDPRAELRAITLRIGLDAAYEMLDGIDNGQTRL